RDLSPSGLRRDPGSDEARRRRSGNGGRRADAGNSAGASGREPIAAPRRPEARTAPAGPRGDAGTSPRRAAPRVSQVRVVASFRVWPGRCDMSLACAAAAWAGRPARGAKPSEGEGDDDDERAVETREVRAPAGVGDRARWPRDGAESGEGGLLEAGAGG